MHEQNTTPTTKRRGKATNHAAPFCVPCRARMKSHATRWTCPLCVHGVYKHTIGEPRCRQPKSPKLPALFYPFCVPCRFRMNSGGRKASRWQCRRCNASDVKQSTGEPSNQTLAWRLLRMRENRGDLFSFIDSKLTGYSVEMREELRGEIALVLLSHAKVNGERVTRATLTAATVREIAKPIYRTMPNRFREVSLDHCYDVDGTRLEERLAG